MPGYLLRSVAGAVCGLLVWCCLAMGQDRSAPVAPASAKTTPTTESGSAAVEEVQPSIFYLPDKDGKLQAVLNVPLETFEKAVAIMQGLALPEPGPRYAIQRMTATGKTGPKHAELTVHFTILVRKGEWVAVPLRLDRAILREPVQYNGPGEQFTHFAGSGRGYVSWIRGQAGQQHELTMKVLAPLATVGNATRLKLLAPRSTVSELKLTVPVAGAEGSVSERARLEPPSPAAGETTELTARGIGGDFELTWWKPGRSTPEVPVVLEAVGAVLARIDSRGIDSEAILSVRSLGAAFDQFRVRLPKGTQWVQGTPVDYEVVPVVAGDPAVEDPSMVEVRLKTKSKGPVEIRLNTRRPHNLAQAGGEFELAGFEVDKADRQWGHIAVAVAGDWQIDWGTGRGVRRVDQWPDSLRNEDVVAGFEYLGKDCSLPARLVARQTRISVEPEYLLLVDAHRIELEATLKYTIRGAKAFELEVGLPDWTLDKVEPENVVDVDGVRMRNDQTWLIPLLQPSTGQLALRISASRPIPDGATSLSIGFPQPVADLPGPAAVVVLPADNVELSTDDESMDELTRQQVPPQTELPERQQDPLFYRAESADAVFEAGFAVHAQSIAVDASSRLHLDGKAGNVEQKLTYTIAYERAHYLTVDVPRSLARSNQLEFELDGEPVTAKPLPGMEESPDAAGPVRMRIQAPDARIGSCELVVRYPLSSHRLAPNRPTVLRVPLVMPVEGTLSANVLYVSSGPGIRVESPGDPWTTSQPGPAQSDGRRDLRLNSDRRSGQVELSVELEDTDETETTVVDRAWVQTWLHRSVRQDRAVFSFTSNQKELRVVVPSGAAVGQVQVLLDQQRVAAQTTKDGLLVIPLPNDASDRSHVLELRAHFPQQRPEQGRLSMEIPWLGRGVWVRRMYWQLVLPENEHVVSAPAGFISESAWGWHGYFWGRTPLLDESELEDWVGVSTRGQSAREGTNTYLFSTFGAVERCELRTASRPWIVLIGSGSALVVGLLLIYVPATRRPGTLFGAGILLLCSGILYPEMTLMVAQAASLGLVLTLLAGLLQHGVARRRRGLVRPESSGSRLEQGSSQSPRPVSEAPPQDDEPSSTQTTPLLEPPPNRNSDA